MDQAWLMGFKFYRRQEYQPLIMPHRGRAVKRKAGSNYWRDGSYGLFSEGYTNGATSQPSLNLPNIRYDPF
jgi:hypothetical protein